MTFIGAMTFTITSLSITTFTITMNKVKHVA
jgi:hypothetical protein